MVENHGGPEAGQPPRHGPEVVKRQRVSKDQAAQRLRSWTVQNEMRGVLRRVSAGAAGRILNSSNSREIRLHSRLCPLQRRRGRTQQA